MSFSWRKVLTVLQDMAAASTTAGTYMAFDMVADGYNHLEFRTLFGAKRQRPPAGNKQPDYPGPLHREPGRDLAHF
jgi:hypothetical protein